MKLGFVFIEALIVVAVLLLLMSVTLTGGYHFLVSPLRWQGWLVAVSSLTAISLATFWAVAMRR